MKAENAESHPSLISVIVEQTETAKQKGALARWALEQEARLTPKPALVDTRSGGVHPDMNLALMCRSAEVLEPFFTRMAALSGPFNREFRAQLGQLGREAETAMLQATNNINTHRGAIWALGLMVAASSRSTLRNASQLLRAAGELACMEDPASEHNSTSHGAKVIQRYRVGGAKAQAQAGFPAIAELGLPTLRNSRQQGDGENIARLNALLSIMSQLSDTCVLHRSGMKGLEAMQSGAKAVLTHGGAGTLDGRRALMQLDNTLVALNAPAGGVADLLAATLLVDALYPEQEA